MFKLCFVLTSCLVVGLCAPALNVDDSNGPIFICKDRSKIIEQNVVCNGFENCADASDEDPDMCDTWKCSDTIPYKCKRPSMCLPISWVCNGIVDCQDRGDEDPEFCQTFEIPNPKNTTLQVPLETEGYVLNFTQFQCQDGEKIISTSKICDGIPDCADKSDEKSDLCNFHPKINLDSVDKFEVSVSNESVSMQQPRLPYEFTCANEKGGLAATYVCDGNPDCEDHSDENKEMCLKWECAPEVPFKCKTNGLCIPEHALCDKKNDCPDGSDEENIKCLLPEATRKDSPINIIYSDKLPSSA